MNKPPSLHSLLSVLMPTILTHCLQFARQHIDRMHLVDSSLPHFRHNTWGSSTIFRPPTSAVQVCIRHLKHTHTQKQTVSKRLLKPTCARLYLDDSSPPHLLHLSWSVEAVPAAAAAAAAATAAAVVDGADVAAVPTANAVGLFVAPVGTQ